MADKRIMDVQAHVYWPPFLWENPYKNVWLEPGAVVDLSDDDLWALCGGQESKLLPHKGRPPKDVWTEEDAPAHVKAYLQRERDRRKPPIAPASSPPRRRRNESESSGAATSPETEKSRAGDIAAALSESDG